MEAQNIKVESFSRLENDITARVNVVRDANDDECALIKMVTTDAGYNLDEELKRESRVGEIWFYVPQGTKRIVIRHQKLGKLVYVLPEMLKSKTTYQIKLPDNIEIIVHEDAGGQYLVMNVQPSDASVYVDNMLETMAGGVLSKMLKYGEHTYRVEHPLYEASSGKFVITNKKEQLDIKLVPAYGYLAFTSTPANAEVTVNGKMLGRTPLKSEALREGSYHVKTTLSSYSTDERDVTVVRGQTSDVSIPLSATFGYLEINSSPEQGANVYVNDMQVGKTPYRSDKLSAGVYKIKVVQSMYAPQEREVQIVKGQTQKVSFDLAATFSEVTIRTEELQAKIYINGEKKGTGLWKGRLTAGIYQLASRMDGYRNGTKSVEIKPGVNLEIVIPAPAPVYGTLNINSNPVGGIIKIDGKEVGRTPDIISKVLVGERKLEIVREGCAASIQRVVIEEGKVKELNVDLSQGEEVTIDAYAPARIEIDGVDYGKTPFKGMLSYGKHSLVSRALSAGLNVQDTFTVSETSSKDLFIRNGKFDNPYNRVRINGVEYSFSVKLYHPDEVDGLFEFDFYTQQRKKLKVPYPYSLSSSFNGDIQGCFVFGGYAWLGGKWKSIEDFSGSVAKDCCVATHGGHGYLYVVKHFQDHFEVVRKDIVTNKNQTIFSYNTKLMPYGVIEVVSGTRLRYSGDFWTKTKSGGIKSKKEGFDFYFRTDSLLFPSLVSSGCLMNKVDAQPIINEMSKANWDNDIKNQIDWKTFPGGSRIDNNVYIINGNAYVVVETVVREIKKGSPNYYRDKHSVTLYKYDPKKHKWSLCAPNVSLNKIPDWKSKGLPDLPLYRVYVRNATLMFDSRYQYNTETDSWKDFSNL